MIIPELIERSVRSYGPLVAVVDGDRQLTFAEAGDRSARLANALVALTAGLSGQEREEGAAAGEGTYGPRVAICMRNRLEYIELDLAIARASLTKVPINPRLSDDERRFVLEDSGASVVFTEASERDRIEAVVKELPGSPTIVVVDGPGPGPSYDELLSASPVAPVATHGRDQLSLLLYTSGTTGRPKGAMLTDGCRVAGTTAMLVDEFSPTWRDGMVHAGPLSHGSGSKVLMYFTRGARNVLIPKFEPEVFVRAVQEQGATSSFFVPTMIQMLVDHLGDGPAPERLRNLSYGGASISRPLLERALDKLGPVLTQVYGSCEAPHPVTVLRHRDEQDPTMPQSELVPMGRPTMASEIRLAPPGEAEPEGAGELWIKGANVMHGYWGKPDATAEVLVDGWYRSGDVVQPGEDGLYYLVDRAKDLIISGGLNVYPAEVERVLRDHPGVADVCVVGVADDRWGEIVAAAIVPNGNAPVDDASIDAWSAEHMAGYKKPRLVRVMDDLPKGSTGKVLKREVKAQLEAKR